MKIGGLPVIEVDESEEITVAVRADDLLEGDTADPERHPIAIALRRQDDVDDALVTKNETDDPLLATANSPVQFMNSTRHFKWSSNRTKRLTDLELCAG